MIMQVPAIHKIQYEAQFVGRLKCIRHAHNERTALLYTDMNMLADNKGRYSEENTQ